MSTIITRNPIIAINKAKQLEQRGYIVAMSANGDKLILTYTRKVAMDNTLNEVKASTGRLRAVLAQPLLSDAERELLRAADARNVAACIRAEREARIPKPDADGWEF